MLQIKDLSYFEYADNKQKITGGAFGVLAATALAAGSNNFTYTNTDLDLKTKKNGGAKLKGIGVALAVGEDPEADVSYYLQGFDKVKVKTINKTGSNYDLEIVKIKAIDYPNK